MCVYTVKVYIIIIHRPNFWSYLIYLAIIARLLVYIDFYVFK